MTKYPLSQSCKGTIETEYWKPIDGYHGYYEISNHGRVKSIARVIVKGNGCKYPVSEKIISAVEQLNGYLTVTLCKDIIKKQFSIHRLVAIHFIENPSSLPEVNHKTGNKKCNYAWELEWSDRQAQIDHAWKIGLTNYKNQVCKNSRFTNLQVSVIKEAFMHGHTNGSIAKYFNVNKTTISKIRSKVNWVSV
jgi:hypothetical protein